MPESSQGESIKTSTGQNPGILYFLCLFWFSASVLAYEFLLMRLLALMVWTPFVHLIISLAMLGFGVSGSCLWILRKRVQEQGIGFIFKVYLVFTLLCAVCLHLSQSIDFNAFMLLWDIREYWKFLLLVFVFFLPFLIGAIGLGSFFIIGSGGAGRIYFFNLIGSAAGIVILAYMMNFLPPPWFGTVVIVLSIIGLFCLIFSNPNRSIRIKWEILCILISIVGFYLLTPLKIQMSEYKSLKRTLQMPDSKIIAEEYSPLGWLQAVESPSFHYMPGVSLNFTGEPFEQIALFLDGELLGAVDQYHREGSPDWYFHHAPQELAYYFQFGQSVLIIGASGGSEVQQALKNKVGRIDIVDADHGVKEIIDTQLPDFSGALYSHPYVKFIIKNARTHLKQTKEKYNLIVFPPAGSDASTVAGMSALNENYIFTSEALLDAISNTKEHGIIYLSAWIRYPPKEGIKLIALTIDALRKSGVENPGKHLLIYRSWNICSIIISPSPICDEFQKEAIRFINDHSFDAVYYDGITSDQVNRYNFMEDAPYFTAAQMILSGHEDELYERNLFSVRPSTDNKPFFANFLKWSSIPVLYRTMSADWIPFMDWGQLLTVAALIHALVIGLVLIFLPLIFSRSKLKSDRSGSTLWMVIYFSAIGIGFFLLEIGFIQRFSLVMLHPIYSSFIVVGVFLVGAGLGSLCYQHLKSSTMAQPWRFFKPILVLLVIYVLILQSLLQFTLQFSSTINVFIAVILILPLAFFMGMAFPCGLEKLSGVNTNRIPWAWGVNAYTSVLAGIVAPLVAQSGGFILMMLLALVCYICAGLVCRKLT